MSSGVMSLNNWRWWCYCQWILVLVSFVVGSGWGVHIKFFLLGAVMFEMQIQYRVASSSPATSYASPLLGFFASSLRWAWCTLWSRQCDLVLIFLNKTGRVSLYPSAFNIKPRSARGVNRMERVWLWLYCSEPTLSQQIRGVNHPRLPNLPHRLGRKPIYISPYCTCPFSLGTIYDRYTINQMWDDALVSCRGLRIFEVLAFELILPALPFWCFWINGGKYESIGIVDNSFEIEESNWYRYSSENWWYASKSVF